MNLPFAFLLEASAVHVPLTLLIVFGIGTLVNHLRLDFGSWLLSFIPLLVYGLLLGSLSFQWRR